MDLTTKAQLLWYIGKWRATWAKRDLDYKDPLLSNPKFITAREAAEMITDNSVCFSSGMAANARCSIFFWAIRERFEKSGHPSNLTWIVVGAQGSRGKVPGTLEEMKYPGLVTRFIAGHLETVKEFLKLGDKKQMELHTMPQGVQAFLLRKRAEGTKALITETALGTFLDPRVGNGTYVGGAPMTENFVTTHGEDKLKFHLPEIDFNMFVAPYCDAEGNIYKKNAACMTESYESSLATKAAGGMVIASVADVIPKDEKNIFIPADKVDFIVVNPASEQTGGVRQRKYWSMFTDDSKEELGESIDKIKFVNGLLKITPVRTPVENATGRLAASLFTKVISPGSLVNIGVGLPEEVARLCYEGGIHTDIKFFSETGAFGGIPAAGIFFGACVNPEEITTSATVFQRAYDGLDCTVLGLLEADSDGNVNVSKRGDGCWNYVGPGGFPDLTTAAKNIIFVGSWMAHAKMSLEEGKIVIEKPGPHKFCTGVSEMTFNGKVALEKGKNVYYVTNVGQFKLTEKGMLLEQVMPGIDVQKDILDTCPMKIVLPEGGKVPVVPKEIVTGKGFKLTW